MDHPVLTVVIPVYNDAAALRAAVPASVEVLEGLGLPFELILCEDASTDGSRETAAAFAASDDRIRVNHSDVRRGKGGALSDALAASHGDIFCFYDVDLSTDLANLPTLLEKIQAGADIVVGSRFLAQSTVLRSGDREATSVGFNRLVRMLLGSSIRDHQCGFKAFRRERLVKLMPYVQARGWTWDTEVLALAQRCGLTIEEIPITWTQGEKTNVRTRDIFSMGWSVLQLAWRIRIAGRYPKDI
ncbi:glycosyltransferase [Methanocorpusculum vombati]|uniref:Glycosyltransferase n=1 Tax=Methanocorpusculum vombati TaxID=3002864 RepID=A0ABT4IJZ2_9EURY|nr:glycosyltransferase [Methanocorpusculum vombati]MCZ9319504.1 glycosyltransferase [Methanocorpusculum sp.]MCZ0862046.1 glycosyltransferase [Methanocorpusculum vombati]MDE2520441.1 glycosyltransferase [Methanocorpusculum sp.]MDE2534111.1 glycosyltransferase [Methanocorpusculum sp.]MDE2545706.1 glycosyltransferase [Methanocorpusculum sp.]